MAGWKYEISTLMKDFCIPRKIRDRIISEVCMESSSSETSDQKYERAMRKFRDLEL